MSRLAQVFIGPLALAGFVLLTPLSADGQESGKFSNPPPDHELPAHVKPLSELPREIMDLHDDLGFCIPFSELQGREHIITVEDGPRAFARMFIVPCAGGGYNLSSVVYLESAGDVALSNFETYSREEGWGTAPEIFNTAWDDQRHILRSFLKGRSLGNCGSIAEWRYIDGELRLEKYFYEADCDSPDVPGEFPLVFNYNQNWHWE